MQKPQTITTCLWFDHQAEEAAHFYTTLFDDSRITEVTHYGEEGPGEPGTVLTVAFELAGQGYVALNGGPLFHFSEAISLQVGCETQDEIDRLWDRFTADGGEESECGWLKDKYGLSWQIIPRRLPELLRDPDPAKAAAVTRAMHTMRKIDVPTLEAAYKQ